MKPHSETAQDYQPIDPAAAWCGVAGITEECIHKLEDIKGPDFASHEDKLKQLTALLRHLRSFALQQWNAITAAEALADRQKLDKEKVRHLESRRAKLVEPLSAWIEASTAVHEIQEIADALADSTIGRRVEKVTCSISESVELTNPHRGAPKPNMGEASVANTVQITREEDAIILNGQRRSLTKQQQRILAYYVAHRDKPHYVRTVCEVLGYKGGVNCKLSAIFRHSDLRDALFAKSDGLEEYRLRSEIVHPKQ